MLFTGLPSISWTMSPGMIRPAAVAVVPRSPASAAPVPCVDLADERALDPEAARDVGAQAGVEADPEDGAHDPAVGDELRDDAAHGVDRHREADPRARTRGAVDRGVDADEAARRCRGAGRPELPGLMAASVWMTSKIVAPLTPWMVRPRALTMPVVRVKSRPKGLPIA